MAKTLQFRRYTTANLSSITGANGELIIDTTLNAITVHTGSQPGGFYTANAITLQAAFNQANAAYAQANTDLTYLASNVAIILGIDVTQNNTGNLAFAQANAAYSSQNVTGSYANSAYTAANGANANAISSGVYANSAFSSANGINLTQNTNITAAFTQANSSYGSQNTTGTYANSAYTAANGANANAITSGTYANAAFLTANTPSNVANSAALYANAAFTAANTAANTIPQNLQTTNYVLQLSDAGKHIYYTQASNTTLYIPNSGQASFQNGAAVLIVSQTTSAANVTITPNTGVSLYLAGNTTSASRNVTTYGMATLMRVAANTWFINGTGVV